MTALQGSTYRAREQARVHLALAITPGPEGAPCALTPPNTHT